MNIQSTNELTTLQKQEILKLAQICKSIEPITLDFYLLTDLNIDKEKPAFFLGYEDTLLVSVLLAFFPSEEEVEFNGCTHPDFRNRGYMTHLIDTAIPYFSGTTFSRALFLREKGSGSGKAYLDAHYPSIVQSEYVMALEKKDWKTTEMTGNLQEVTDPNIFFALNKEIFSRELDEQQMQNILASSERQFFLYYHDGEPVGILNIRHCDHQEAMLHGVGILPAYRRRGLGEQMLSEALNLIFQTYRIATLEVNSKNPNAFALYQKLGFIVENQVDYHARIL